MIKIKVNPEDFIVEEIADIPMKKEGGFGVYLLKKTGWNTVDVIKRISKSLNIPFSDFSYGGKKDRYALTTQFITIARHGYDQIDLPHPPQSPFKRLGIKEICEENYSLSFVGFMDRPMGPNLIKGNKFEITIRGLTEDDLKSSLSEIESVKKYGYPNYFDDQRFGSFDPKQGFIAEKIMMKHYNGALKIYLTHIRPEDKKEEKERKRFFFENWSKWQLCLGMAKSGFEKMSFEYLMREPKGFIPILQKISHEEMSTFFSAYQSHLWNELLRRIIKSECEGSLNIYKGVAGNYLFYNRLNAEHYEYLSSLYIPTPASNVRMPDPLTETLYSEVLKDNNLKTSMFNIRKIRQAFFKGTERKAIILPEDLSFDYSEDEIYHGQKKLTLKFFLPRGCFGTMLIKRLFIQPDFRV